MPYNAPHTYLSILNEDNNKGLNNDRMKQTRGLMTVQIAMAMYCVSLDTSYSATWTLTG